jgi:hypothetical protein
MKWRWIYTDTNIRALSEKWYLIKSQRRMNIFKLIYLYNKIKQKQTIYVFSHTCIMWHYYGKMGGNM